MYLLICVVLVGGVDVPGRFRQMINRLDHFGSESYSMSCLGLILCLVNSALITDLASRLGLGSRNWHVVAL